MSNSPPQVLAGVEYTVCRPGDTEEIGYLLSESFTRHDPPAVAVDLTAEDFEAFVRLWIPAAGTEGLTIVARDVATHELAGALLTEDAASPPPQGLSTISEKFDPILDLLGQIDAEYRTDKSIEPGQLLHLFLRGVAEQFARRKIGQHLVAVCLANGADRGYAAAVTEATNPVSQHIFRQLGFQERAMRSYRDSDSAAYPPSRRSRSTADQWPWTEASPSTTTDPTGRGTHVASPSGFRPGSPRRADAKSAGSCEAVGLAAKVGEAGWSLSPCVRTRSRWRVSPV